MYRGDCGIKCLFRRGIFGEYHIKETKNFLKENVQEYEKIKDDLVKLEYIRSLERAEDFFVHKLSFEKVCVIHIFELIINIHRLKADHRSGELGCSLCV